ncbi:MAG: DUF1018 domain-containing protein [Deltaproteobacteria bacterium]|nr:DUF1018 domain-containing protein [Deltaproteobacteria bacterium]
MRAIRGKGKKLPDRLQKQRNGLLAKVHIAKKELGIDEGLYRMILREEFGVETAAALMLSELESLVKRFESKGWQSKTANTGCTRAQIDALKERVGQEVLHSDLTPARFRGLVRKVCRVDDLRFCNDPDRLKRLLAVIGKIKSRGEA